MTQIVGTNKYVEITYRILDSTGNVLEQMDIPVGYVHGVEQRLIEKIEMALAGRVVGDKIRVKLQPEEAFGPHRSEFTYTDDIENVPEDFRYVGAEVPMQNDRGEVREFRVSRIENGKITVDGNHPLAGKILTFHVEVNSIRDAMPQDLNQACSDGPSLTH